MRKNKDNIVYINKQLNKIYICKKKIIDIAKILGTSREIIGKWYKEFISKGQLNCKKHISINKYSKNYNKKILEKYKSQYELMKKRLDNSRNESIWLPSIRYFKYTNKILCSTEHIKKLLIKNSLINCRKKEKLKKQLQKK